MSEQWYVNGKPVAPPQPPTQMDRIENLLAAILATLVANRPENMPKSMPTIQLPPAYTEGAHLRAAFPPPLMEKAPPYQKDPPAYAWMNNPRMTVSGPLTSALPLPPARPAGSLHMVGPLADPIGTPGAVHPDYTEADIDKTIRVPGWTSTVRPPTSYTTPLKIQMMREYGYPPDTDPASLELDHKVPLCVLGHPTSPLNLYPQPREGKWGARVKDICEVAAQHAVLNGHISLAEAQAGFMGSWVDLHIKLFSNPAIVASMMAMTMKPPEDEP